MLYIMKQTILNELSNVFSSNPVSSTKYCLDFFLIVHLVGWVGGGRCTMWSCGLSLVLYNPVYSLSDFSEELL